MFLSMCTLFYKGFILDVCMTRIQKSGKYECTFSWVSFSWFLGIHILWQLNSTTAVPQLACYCFDKLFLPPYLMLEFCTDQFNIKYWWIANTLSKDFWLKFCPRSFRTQFRIRLPNCAPVIDVVYQIVNSSCVGY